LTLVFRAKQSNSFIVRISTEFKCCLDSCSQIHNPWLGDIVTPA